MGLPHRDARQVRPAWPDRAIAEIAVRQQTIVSRRGLLALGVAPRTIAAALARGRLHRVHLGVYSLVPAAVRPPLAAEWAAVLATGPHAVLSHATAARLHGLAPPLPPRRGELQLTVVGRHRRPRPGLTVHRTSTLDSSERLRLHGLPVTSVARTVLDQTPSLNDGELEQLIDRALRKTSRTKLLATVERHPRRPGTARVRRLLDPDRPSADTWSAAEARLLALIRRSGLPAPEANVPLGRTGYVPDLLWREHKVIVEYDSWDFHSGPAAFHADRERRNNLTAAGYQILHVTRRQLGRAPEKVLVWIIAALIRAGADLH